MASQVTIKVTIIEDNKPPLECMFFSEGVTILQEREVTHYNSIEGNTPIVLPTNKTRGLIKFWSGCKDYEDFKPTGGQT